jgi:flagellar protein FliS
VREVAVVLTENDIYEKTSQELTSLLYVTIIDKLEKATEAITKKNYLLANQLLQSSNDILYRLGAGINYEAGIIADQLEAIYNYMAERLIQANFRKDVSLIEEVIRLLKIISEAWDNAMKLGMSPVNQTLRKKAIAYEQDLFYDNVHVDRKE